jgi:ribonuclease P protein component
MKPQGFRKEYRLLKRRDFFFGNGETRTVQTKSFTILCCENLEKGPRLGIVASRKVGNAVTRNRIKRLVREFFRVYRNVMHRREDIVVIVRPKTRVRGYADAEKELRVLVEKG